MEITATWEWQYSPDKTDENKGMKTDKGEHFLMIKVSRVNTILGHKTNLSKYKGREIISSIFPGHDALKPEINHRKRNEKKLTAWKLNSMPGKTYRSVWTSKRRLKPP